MFDRSFKVVIATINTFTKGDVLKPRLPALFFQIKLVWWQRRQARKIASRHGYPGININFPGTYPNRYRIFSNELNSKQFPRLFIRYSVCLAADQTGKLL